MYILKCNFRSLIHAIFTFAALPPPWDLLYLCLPQPLIEGPKSLFTVRGSETGSVYVREATADSVSSMFAFPVL